MTGAAETAFVGGPVVTMDPVRSVTDAVAVRDGRIAALGATEVASLITSRTEVIELAGRSLLPGFQDAHVHPIYGGLQRLRCDLGGSRDAGECLRRVGEYARRHSGGNWILGGGWDPGLFPGGCPERTVLDTVTGERPACLLNQDQHGAWVNTTALRLAGIDGSTADPPHGRIERDASGQPSGTLHEAAVELVARCVPPADAGEYRAGLLEAQRYLHSHGVTAWHDAIVGPYLGYADTLRTYLDADREGLLTARVTGSLWWEPSRGREQIAELLDRSRRARGLRFRADSVKIMQDGVCENFTAAMLAPYLGEHGSGTSRVEPGELRAAVRELDAAGFAVHFHAVGDRAVREALDAVAAARASNGHGDRRHQIAHVQVVHPDDVPRFAELGVAANIQAAWAVNDAAMTELTLPYLGRQRSSWQYPFRALAGAGAVLAAGSDWPVSDADPLLAVHVAVNRREPGSTGPALLAEQALDPVEAFAATTIDSARVHRLDTDTGSIEPGKKADLVVLDADPFALPAERIGTVAAELTMVGGTVVHRR